MFKRSALLVATLSGLVLSTNALASGGNYAFEGGTPSQRETVKKALDASAFPWGIVPKQITIKIGTGYESEARRGTISLDADLLDAGVFSWGTIQHEYAHEVDFFLFDDATRARLFPILGGKCWFATCGALHGELASERFASTLAWSYWPRYANTMKPEGPGDESAAMKPAAFRALMAHVLGVPAALPPQPQAARDEWVTSAAKSKARAKRKRGGR